VRILRVVGLVVLAAGPWLPGCGATVERAHGEDVVLQRRRPAALSQAPAPEQVADMGPTGPAAAKEAEPTARQQAQQSPGWASTTQPATVAEAPAASGSTSAPAEPGDEHPLAAGVRAASRASAGLGNPSAGGDVPKVEERDRKVQVAGIEGTLANFDVRVTMEARAREFGACHAPRLRKVPGLSGNVEFKIRVLADGSVSSVELPSSDLGDRALERCFAGVIKATQFPKPRGGDANVTYNMQLSPSRKGREPEQWEAERIRHVLQKRADDVREMCALRAPRAYRTTIYVNRRGKVVAAGVAGKADADGAYDCIADAVRKWPMPKAKKKALAKVTFAMAGTT
jgi:hypothetical protein